MLASLFWVGYYFACKNEVLSKPQIKLPKLDIKGNISIEEAISKRKTYRVFSHKLVTLAELSQLLWAAQGTHGHGLRAAPSAPLELFIIVRNMQGLESGTYHYLVAEHTLERHINQTFEQELYKAAYKQQWVKNAKLIIVVAADFRRTEKNTINMHHLMYGWKQVMQLKI